MAGGPAVGGWSISPSHADYPQGWSLSQSAVLLVGRIPTTRSCNYCWLITALPRDARLTSAGVVAVLGLVAGGITACASSDDVVATVAEVPIAPEIGSNPEESRPAVLEAVSTGPTLNWIEFDPIDVLGPDGSEIRLIEAVGDGRVIARASTPDSFTALVSDDGRDWTQIPLPPSLDRPDSIDITGDRWLVAGSDKSGNEPITRAFFSDDQGASWTELDFRSGSGPWSLLLVAAIAAHERMVLAVKRNRMPLTTLIVARGFAQDEEEILEYSMEGTTVRFTLEGSSSRHSFELTLEEAEMLSGPGGSGLLIFYSDGGPPELVADVPGGLHAGGYGAADGFRLFVFHGFPAGSKGDSLLASPDGRQWTTTIADYENYEFGVSPMGTIWTTDEVDGEYRAERFDGVYGPDQVLAIPDGTSSVESLAVGPAGILALAEPGKPFGPEVDPGTQPGDSDSVMLSEFDQARLWVGWSDNGSKWGWQTVAEAFDLTNLADMGIEVYQVNLAVGDDYAIAQIQIIQTMDSLPADADASAAPIMQRAGNSSSPSVYTSPLPPRWFIAAIE